MHIGNRAIKSRRGGIYHILSSGIAFDQTLLPVEIDRRLDRISPRGQQAGLGIVKIGADVAIVENRQDFAGLNFIPFFDVEYFKTTGPFGGYRRFNLRNNISGRY